jgi:hypothetical protein
VYVPGGEEVVEPHLRAIRPRGEVDETDPRTLVLEESGDAAQGGADGAVGHHIGVEDQVDLAIVQRDLVELGEDHLPAIVVRAQPVPDAEQRHGEREAVGDGAVGSPICRWARGGTSSAMSALLRVSYLTGLPVLGLRRGVSGHSCRDMWIVMDASPPS